MILVVTHGSHNVESITEKEIVDFFSRYNKGFEAFFYFCQDKYVYRSPNASTYRCNYCPMCGKKINWNDIYDENKMKFHDYDPKLDKTFKYNN